MPKKVKSFDLHLDDIRPYYCPKDPLCGRLSFQASSDVMVKNVRLQICGMVSTKVKNKDNDSKEAVYRQESEIFNHPIFLCGSDGKGYSGIPKGNHEFPFTYILPDNLPSSYGEFKKGKSNLIYYFMEAVFNYQNGSKDKISKSFPVKSNLDINQPEYACPPPTVEDETVIGGCCCRASVIRLRASIARTGYLPSESIIVNGEVENLSYKRLSNLSFKLMRTETLTAEGRSVSKTTEVSKMTFGNIRANQILQLNEKPFVLPSDITPSILNCDLIEITYNLHFTLTIPSVSNMCGNFPIVIGTADQQSDDMSTTIEEQPVDVSQATGIALSAIDLKPAGKEDVANSKESLDSLPPYSSVAAAPSAPTL